MGNGKLENPPQNCRQKRNRDGQSGHHLEPSVSATHHRPTEYEESCVNNFLQFRLKKPFDSFTKLKKVFIKIVTLKLHIFKK